MPKAIYIHIPFCEHICHYCDFNKIFLQGQPVDEYIDALLVEMEYAAYHHKWEQIETIYIGGGTPTALSVKQLEKIMKHLHKLFIKNESLKEFTVEANPGGVSKEQLQLLHEYGVNRLSIGAQTFSTEMLKKLGRTHEVNDIERTVHLARDVGFHNLSIDLMFGLPNETIDMFSESLQKALTLNVDHYSAYSLKIEPKTIFYNKWQKGALHLPDDDDEAVMYEKLRETMEEHGFWQYEISNFAKVGFESVHNLTYWNNEQYFGFGAGAHSYVNGYRNSNCGPVQKYISLIKEKQQAIVDQHFVTEREKMEEEMFLGLRKIAGVSRKRFYEKFHQDVLTVYKTQIEQLEKRGLIEVTDESIKLAKNALFIGNIAFEQFLMSE